MSRVRTRWMLVLVAALTVASLVGASPAGAIGMYADPPSDSGTAGDVTGIQVASDVASGQTIFRITGNNLSTSDTQLTFLDIDSDANPNTGNVLAGGIDYFFGVDNASYGFFRWSGTDWVDTPDSTVTITGGGGTLIISVNKREIGNTSDFNFDVFTVDTNNQSSGDEAPDDGMFNYSLDKLGPLITAIATKASKPKAGKRFSVSVTGLTLPPSGRTVDTPILPESVSCVATLKGARIARSCSFKLPKNAKGKALRVSVTVKYQGATATKVLNFKVG